MFDFTPLTQSHIILGGLGFVLTYFVLALLERRPGMFFRQVPGRGGVYYGGVVIIGVSVLLTFFVLPSQRLKLGLLSASFMILLIGAMDEKYKLPARTQIIWQVVIATLAVIWGWSIQFISHPTEQAVIWLDQYRLGSLLVPGSLIAIGWLLLLMNAMNWLDGVDGLAASVGLVSLLTLALLALLPSVQDAMTLYLALIGAGVVLGFLLWNFPPARFFLGTSGSWFLGLYVGMVAILTGGKMVTTGLVLAIPVIDFFWVIWLRLRDKQAPWLGDTSRHLHHRLLLRGFTPRQVVLLALSTSVLLGWGALSLQTYQKMAALGVTGVMLILLSVRLTWQK